MVEQNSKTPDASNDKSNYPHLGEDFEMWLKGREKQKNFLEKKNHLDAQSQLTDLKESLGKKSYEKIKGISEQTSSTQKQSNIPYASDSIAFTDQIHTHTEVGGNAIRGLAQSVSVPFMAFKDGVVDLFKVLGNPKKQFDDTIAYLKEESPTKII